MNRRLREVEEYLTRSIIILSIFSAAKKPKIVDEDDDEDYRVEEGKHLGIQLSAHEESLPYFEIISLF